MTTAPTRSLALRPTMWLLVSAWLVALLAMSVPSSVQAQNNQDAAQEQAATTSYDGTLPPLIDRTLFFGNPQRAGAQISPNGQYVSFRKPYKGVMNIWVKGADEPFEAAQPVTADTSRPVQGYFWTQDSARILYVQDKGGNENYRIYAVDPDAKDNPETGVPPARDLTPYDDVRAVIYAVPEKTPGEIVIGLNDRDARYHDVYRLDLDTGQRDLVIQNDQQVAGWQTDLEGNVRLAVQTTDEGGTEISRVEGDALVSVYTCSFEESCGPVRFHKDGERVYMTTNKGDDVNLTRLILFNPQTGESEIVESDPENEVNFGGAEFSDRTDELVATYYVGDRKRIYPKTDAFEKDLSVLQEKMPDGEISFGASTEDERLRVVFVSSDTDPGSAYLFNRNEETVERLYRSRPELPSEHLAPMQAIRYEARDGLTIPAYLTVPKNVEAENLPTIILPHGGPWARDTWGYDSYAQFFANRGYAVLQPNFRGSTGYGQDFLNAGNAEWGDKMQDDLTDGVQHLIDEGIADPERVGIFGGSYGGYATLAGLTFTPDVYAAGVSYVGPSNLITLLNSIPPYWVSAKKVFKKRMGDLDDPADRERLKRQSPLFSADQIDDPLLVIQGANDPRVKQQESDQIVVAARENGVDVRYLLAENEGHGFANEDNRLAVAAAMEAFFGTHLGGRYQTNMQPESQARLSALEVDIDTVSVPDSTEQMMQSDAMSADLPAMDGSVIEPATLKYTADMNAQGQDVQMQSTRTIEAATDDGRPVWRVIEETQTPQGTMTDTLMMDRETLVPLRRHVEGPFSMKLTYSDDAVRGEMSAMGRSAEVDVSLDKPVMDGGTGLEVALASLPLDEGYRATLRTFEPRQQSVRPLQLTVTGTETVQVPAGTYETYIVQIEPVDNSVRESTTMYVTRQAPHYIVKSEAALSSPMGEPVEVTRQLAEMQRPAN